MGTLVGRRFFRRPYLRKYLDYSVDSSAFHGFKACFT